MYFSNSLRDRKRRKLIISWIFFQPDGMAVGMGEQTSAGPRATPPPTKTAPWGAERMPCWHLGRRGSLCFLSPGLASSMVWQDPTATGQSRRCGSAKVMSTTELPLVSRCHRKAPGTRPVGRQVPSLSSLSRTSRQGVRVMRREEAQRRPRWDAQEKGQAWGTHNPKLRLKTQNETVSLCDTVPVTDT